MPQDVYNLMALFTFAVVTSGLLVKLAIIVVKIIKIFRD